MEKEFVPYELAVKLKALGFDEPCFLAFDNCSIPMRCSDLRTNEQKFNGVNYNSSTYKSQPTFSQAFRWFRDKYGYLSYIDMDNNSFYRYTIYKGKGISEAPLETYEEAELACLDKLIEIVKFKLE